jgi:hypothetical protein
MALMAAHGEITPMPDHAIFADTGAEPRAIYEWLDWLEKQLPFPVHRVMWKDGLKQNIVDSVVGGRFAGAPFFTERTGGKGRGQLKRQCTNEYKILPIIKKTREILGLAKWKHGPEYIAVVMWQGISSDEIQRARKGVDRWTEYRYPLIEKRMSRNDCLKWMADKGYPAPSKSACIWCPYHSDSQWLEQKINDPESWAQSVEMDELIRGGVRGTTQRLYLHRSLKPLAEVRLVPAERAGDGDPFSEECEGMCGL